jgi:hypothetical protein
LNNFTLNIKNKNAVAKKKKPNNESYESDEVDLILTRNKSAPKEKVSASVPLYPKTQGTLNLPN